VAYGTRSSQARRVHDLCHLYGRAIYLLLEKPPKWPELQAMHLVVLGVPDPDEFVVLMWEAERTTGERQMRAQQGLPEWAKDMRIAVYADQDGERAFPFIDEIAEQPPRAVTWVTLDARRMEREVDLIALVAGKLLEIGFDPDLLCCRIRCEEHVRIARKRMGRRKLRVEVESWWQERSHEFLRVKTRARLGQPREALGEEQRATKTTRRRRPPQTEQRNIARSYEESGKTQVEVAALLTASLRKPVSQSKVSRSIRAENRYRRANPDLNLPQIETRTRRIPGVDPRVVGLGKRQDGLARRQRPRKNE
jgi:hypothetical protein